jgi:NADPH-dependent curcumin reductase CurA
MLEAAIDAANNYARIIVCGAISSYNGESHGIKASPSLKGLPSFLT